MSIKSIYATNIYVKDLDIPENKLQVIESFVKAQHLAFKTNSNNDHIEYSDGNENIIRDAIEENQCPEMDELIQEIKKGYTELAYSCIDTFEETNQEKIILDVVIESCKINWMKPGYRLGAHTHYGDDAFACFYFNDVPENEGGELVLYDPRWQRNYCFGGSKLEKIKSKRGRLVIAPSFLWHEVTQYNGKEDRLTLVVNAQIQNVYDKIRSKKLTTHT